MKDISQICVNEGGSAIDALNAINKTNAYIALVVDGNQKLLGTITDGDIRRGLLNGKKLESSVLEFMNTKYQSICQDEYSERDIKIKFKDNLMQLPVLDHNGKLIELALQNEIFKPQNTPKKNTVVIMAGGKGTRLRPHTSNCPKPMLPVNGKPMLEIILENCIEHGFSNFYFSVNFLKEQIIDYFGDGSHLNVKIKYLIEDIPLGTAGSLKLLPESITDPILVLNGDVLTNLNLNDLINFHQDHNADLTIAARHETFTIPYGVIEVSGIDFIKIEEKPDTSFLVNAGIYFINPSILQIIENGKYFDMPSLITTAKANYAKVLVFPVHEYWIDIGRLETLKQAHKEWPLRKK